MSQQKKAHIIVDMTGYQVHTHSTYWTETWANYLAKQYFGTKWLGMENLSPKNWQFYYPSKELNTLLKFAKFGWKGFCF